MSVVAVSPVTGEPPDHDVAAFADAVRRTMGATPAPAPWHPGDDADDRDARLAGALVSLGWPEVCADPDATAYVAAGAVQLGRGLAPVSLVDAVLGGSPVVAGLARYSGVGDPVVVPGSAGAHRTVVRTAVPLPYSDAWAVCRVELGAPDGLVEEWRVARWQHATVAYLAGLAAAMTDAAVAHATGRAAFRGTLAQLDGVQVKLADAAAATDGLLLAALADGPPTTAELAAAPAAAVAVAAACHQVTGALGFTLEYPLQRQSRRARAVAAWVDAWLDARLGPEAGT